MNTCFSLLDRELELVRYPAKHQHKSLQAWDSADELIIEHLASQELTFPQGNGIILNDDFGALGTWYAAARPHWYSDSWIAHRSLYANLNHNTSAFQGEPQCELQCDDNGVVTAPVSTHGQLSSLPAKPQLVIIKIPRTLALLEQQLLVLRDKIDEHTRVLAAAKVKSVTKTVLALFEKYLGPTSTSLAQKKSRLIFCQPQQSTLTQPQTSPYPTCWEHPASTGQTLTLYNHANVFSRASLDIGARLMLDHMHVTNQEKVIDLGCGNGILGLNALAIAPQAAVTFVDESFMALASARDNVTANFPDALARCDYVASNCLETLLQQNGDQSYDKVLCNPPFHQQNAVTDHIAWQMFNDSRKALRRGGHLIVVANRHLDYHVKLKKVFGGVKVLASNRKFVILSAAKR
ncbi:methyltransferase [Salinimonas marina]|uniref:Ribosomal RNA large subunit methyltransferase G n=1 Tax=Salinimonas marina TaxID=2785918 RepID=A0A7S9DWI7_9ALTE|nr:methyltransferase [Salinimonas marina]QPG05277.1 methyltransferase [Salinimonas marina]